MSACEACARALQAANDGNTELVREIVMGLRDDEVEPFLEALINITKVVSARQSEIDWARWMAQWEQNR